MIRSSFFVRGSVGLLAVGLVATACSEPTTPAAVAAFESRPAFSVESATPMVCPNDELRSATGTVGARGGVIELEGNRVTIPRGAVRKPTLIRMALPVSDYVEVDLTAGTSGYGFQFKKPVSVTLSYAHCGVSAASESERSAWYVDSATGEFLEWMPSQDDPSTQTITFTTPHFSHFIIAD